MTPDSDRIDRNRRGTRDRGFDAVICALPSNVLLASGYWPVVGASLAVVTQRATVLVVPEDERELAAGGFADEVRTFRSASLEKIVSVGAALEPVFRDVLGGLGLDRGRIAIETGGFSQPASYAAMHVFGGELDRMLRAVAPGAAVESADALLRELRTVKTPAEVAHVREACAIVRDAFPAGVASLRPGVAETEAAAALRAGLMKSDSARRADGFAFCMSGPNAAQAYKAYQRSGARPIGRGEPVLLHVNSYAGGYWTDVTRTFCTGEPGDRVRRTFDAVAEARAAALAAVRPGARAADVDRAARAVMERHGLGNRFVHPTGHGVGFAAIDHNARPVLHPRSEDVLQPGMVFNVEPAAYFEGDFGVRHCDMVAVTENGSELLTDFDPPAASRCSSTGC